VKIGRQAARSTTISASSPETIIVRGIDLCSDLIGKVSFTDHLWLLVTGALPRPAQRRVIDAALVAIAEHGLVPSVAASRMTFAAAPEALQGAVAAGILGCGSVILGSAESAARLFADILARGPSGSLNATVRAARRAARRTARSRDSAINCKTGDPRVARLLMIATESEIATPCQVARKSRSW
jgi:citrate synthase